MTTSIRVSPANKNTISVTSNENTLSVLGQLNTIYVTSKFIAETTSGGGANPFMPGPTITAPGADNYILPGWFIGSIARALAFASEDEVYAYPIFTPYDLDYTEVGFKLWTPPRAATCASPYTPARAPARRLSVQVRRSSSTPLSPPRVQPDTSRSRIPAH